MVIVEREISYAVHAHHGGEDTYYSPVTAASAGTPSVWTAWLWPAVSSRLPRHGGGTPGVTSSHASPRLGLGRRWLWVGLGWRWPGPGPHGAPAGSGGARDRGVRGQSGVGSQRGAGVQPFSNCPSPNHACKFPSTWLSSPNYSPIPKTDRGRCFGVQNDSPNSRLTRASLS